jgi:hypothetical protein
MYSNAISVFNQSRHLNQLAKVSSELTGNKYDLSKVEEINKAISELSKFRNKQLTYLKRFTMDMADFKKEHNHIVGTLNGLRSIEVMRSGVEPEDMDEIVKDIIEYETENSNPDIRSTRALRVAEAELTRTLYDLYSNKFKCEALCKISKSIINRLQRHRNSLS